MHDELLHDYTELVIELTSAIRRLDVDLCEVAGGGDSRDGIDRIARAAIAFCEAEKEVVTGDVFWDGGWLDAVLDYSLTIAKLWKHYRKELDTEPMYKEYAIGAILRHAESN